MSNSGKMNLDLSNSNVVSRYLWNKGFFPNGIKKVYDYENYRDEQNKGLDILAQLQYDNKPFRIDLKYATDYIEKGNLKTFCLELWQLSKKDYTTPVDGWYRSPNMETEKYLFGWPKGTCVGSVSQHLDRSQYIVVKDYCYTVDSIDMVYVSKKLMNDFLRNEIMGEDLYDMLMTASYEDLKGLFDINTYSTTYFYKKYVRYEKKNYNGNISKYNLKLRNWRHGQVFLSYPQHLMEGPINLLVERSVYRNVPGALYWQGY